MIAWPLVFGALFGIVFHAAALHASEWPMPGYDFGRTNRTPTPGRISTPRIAWKLDVSAREVLFDVAPAAGPDAWQPDESDPLGPFSSEMRRRWGLSRPYLDVVGDGALVAPPDAPGARWGRFLPDVPGYQRLSWTTTWGQNGRFQMHAFQDGVDRPQLVWEVPFEGSVYAPLVIVTDVDGDGERDVALSTWHGVLVYDLRTGREKYRSMYRESDARQYGFFGAYTAPNGRTYLVVVGDFAGHVAVLAVRDGALKPLWYHRFDPRSEQGIDRRFTINRIGPDPMGDFDGDGRGELLMNVYNEENDGRWHLLAYDLETGEHRLDLPDVFLFGHVDVDGDGRDELLTQVCRNRPVGTNGPLRVYRWDSVIWSHPYGRWSMQSLPELPITRISGATRGMEAPVADSGEDARTITFTEPGERERLHALRIDRNDDATILWTVEGPPGARIDARAARDGHTLVGVRMPQESKGTIHTERATLQAVAARRITLGAPHPLVLTGAGSRPVLVLAEPLNRIGAWEVRTGTKTELQRLWEWPGRAMTTQFPQMLGLTSGDLDGDGRRETLVVRETREGGARIVALGIDGTERWSATFPEFNGRAPVWNETGATRWAVGHFTRRDRLAVLVSNRRSIMHSDETVLLDTTRDGSTAAIWKKDVLEVRKPWTDTPWPHTRGYGGGAVALGDFDGDGLDDIAMTYPAEYSVVDGATGEQLIVENAGPLKGTDNFWVMNGTPLVADLNGDGALETLWTNPNMVLAFRHESGRAVLLWRTEPNDGARGRPAIGDPSGRGRLEIGLPGFEDGFRALDAATGTVLWRVPSRGGGTVSNAVAADIDGDGREEFVYADGTHVLAVAPTENGTRPVLWEIELPAEIADIVVADVDGDGIAEVLASGNDGVVYCIE